MKTAKSRKEPMTNLRRRDLAMDIVQPKVSALLNGRGATFSSERLMRSLTRLGQDVDVTIRAKPRGRARGRIRRARLLAVANAIPIVGLLRILPRGLTCSAGPS